MEKLAKFISDIFSPPVVGTLILLSTPLRHPQVGWPTTLIATFFVTLIPWAALIWMRIRGLVTDIHVTRRHQRWPLLIIALISILAGISVLLALSAPTELLAEVLFLLAGLIIVGVVNLFWKLSVHAAVITFAALHCLLPLLGGAQLAVILIALVGWARIRIDHHSPTQVTAGTLVGVLVSAGDLLT